MCKENIGGCGFIKPKYTKNGLGIDIEINDDRSANPGADRKQHLLPEEAFRIMSKISDYDCSILGLKPEISRPENMIIKNLPVAPPPVRPNVIMSSSSRSEDDLTYSYQQILQKNIEL
jgi:DNA-directed RNA polymerase II subunit RPB1